MIKRLLLTLIIGSMILFEATHAHARGYRHRSHFQGHKVGLNRRTTPSAPIAALVARSAAAHGIPVPLALAVIWVESNFNPRARNGHALGLGQVLPATARSVGIDPGRLLTLAGGLEASMRYLALAVARHGPGCAAASSYNLGLFARTQCSSYGRKVMRLAGMV